MKMNSGKSAYNNDLIQQITMIKLVPKINHAGTVKSESLGYGEGDQ